MSLMFIKEHHHKHLETKFSHLMPFLLHLTFENKYLLDTQVQSFHCLLKVCQYWFNTAVQLLM